MKIILANSRGFCSGVKRAIELAEKVLSTEKTPVYIFHELVHNQYVVNQLKEKNALFVNEIENIPDNAVVILSAHGVSKAITEKAKQKHLKIFDATCTIVEKIHELIRKASLEKKECILIGHAKHPEIEGALGQYEGKGIYLIERAEEVKNLCLKDPVHCLYVTQTTLSVDDTKEIINELHHRFPTLPKQQGSICNATQARQMAVKGLAKQANKIIVLGSQNSSNSKRLKELAEELHLIAYLIDSPEQLKKEDFNDKDIVGITAGASAPEILVQKTIHWFQNNFPLVTLLTNKF